MLLLEVLLARLAGTLGTFTCREGLLLRRPDFCSFGQPSHACWWLAVHAVRKSKGVMAWCEIPIRSWLPSLQLLVAALAKAASAESVQLQLRTLERCKIEDG